MSDRITLTEIGIQGFRRLQEPMMLAIEPGAGVTLLVGPNGSGKSTVLDAIEWALTGEASRLPPMRATDAKNAPDPYKTLGSGSEPQVSLRFADLDDGEIYHLGPDLKIETASKLLRRSLPAWRAFQAASAALRWTHFSSQRSVARLGSENGDAILKAFAGPAGLEGHKDVNKFLWGAPTQQALRKRTAEAQEKVTSHRVALDYVDDVLAASASTTIPDSGPEHRLADLIAYLTRAVGRQYTEFGNDLGALQSALQADRRDAEAALANFRGVAAERRETHLRTRRLEVDAEAARQTAETTGQVEHRRRDAADAARAELDEARQTMESISNDIASGKEQLQKHGRLAAIDAEMQRLVRALNLELARVAAGQRRRQLLDQINVLSARARAGHGLIDARRMIAQYAEFGDTELILEQSATQIEELAGRQDALAARRDAVRAVIRAEEDRQQTLASLASALAAHIREHDQKCPLCAAEYPEGELFQRVAAAAADTGAATDMLGEQLSDVTAELGRVTGQLEFARARSAEASETQRLMRHWRAEEMRYVSAFGVIWSADEQEAVETALAERRSEIDFSDDDHLGAREAELSEAIIAHETAAADLEKQLFECNLSRTSLYIDLQGVPGENDLRARLDALEPAFTRASARHSLVADEMKLALDLESSATQAAQQARETLGPIEALLTEQRARLDELNLAYDSCLLNTEESAYVKSLDAQIAKFGAMLEEVRSIRSESEALRQAAQTDARLEVIRAAYPGEPHDLSNDTLRARILERIAASEADVEQLNALGRKLKERARVRRQIDLKQQGDTLHPWNSLFRAIYTSLAGALGETLEWTTNARASDMRFSEFDARPTPHVSGQPIHGWFAGHFFSEGQLAALQISSMITASILLPWSRWRALLLDDPLQHADVIKVGAFADLMRGLAQDHGHQIILTTHDTDQAEFIATKFRAVNLPATIVHFERQGMIRSTV